MPIHSLSLSEDALKCWTELGHKMFLHIESMGIWQNNYTMIVICIHGKETFSKPFNLSLHPIQKLQNHKQKSPLDFQKKKQK